MNLWSQVDNMKKTKVCQVCKSEFVEIRKDRDRKFCSVECYREHQRSGNYKIETNRIWFNKCHVCGGEANRRPSEKRNGELSDKVFCSRGCYQEFHSADKRTITVKCGGCGKKFNKPGHKHIIAQDDHFCSTACRRNVDKTSKCKQCGSLFTGIQFRKSNRSKSGSIIVRVKKGTCSDKCLKEFYRTNKKRKEKISKAFTGEKHPNWQGGSHLMSNRGIGWTKIAEKARERAKRKCESCGQPENNERKLEVHHKIPYHQFTRKDKANKMSNLEALCKSCHTKADWEWRRNNDVQMPINFRKGRY